MSAGTCVRPWLRYLSVLLEAHADGELELIVKYLVSNASWSPKYDIRVFSEENNLKVGLK